MDEEASKNFLSLM